MNLDTRPKRRPSQLLGGVLMTMTLLGSSGCYKATFVDDPRTAKREATHDEWTDHYVFGLIGDEQFDTNRWCPSGTGTVRTGGNAGTTTLTIITLGIYAPRKVYVTCNEPERVAARTETKP